MDFTINGVERKLNFGVRFTADLDETEKYRSDGIEFGMGLMLTEQKLGMGSMGALAKIIHCALHRDHVLLDEVYDALDVYADNDELGDLFEKIENELKNSNAVRAAKTRMENMSKEANRKIAAQQALKLTKK